MVMGNATIQQSAYDLLFNLNRKYVSILCRFRDRASHLSKFVDFNLPHLHLASPLGVTLIEFRGEFCRQENQSRWAIVRHSQHEPMFNHFSRTPTCDRQTDGHRAIAHIALAQRCAVITVRNIVTFERFFNANSCRQIVYYRWNVYAQTKLLTCINNGFVSHFHQESDLRISTIRIFWMQTKK